MPMTMVYNAPMWQPLPLVNSQQLKTTVYNVARGVGASAVRRERGLSTLSTATEEPRGLLRATLLKDRYTLRHTCRRINCTASSLIET